MWLGDPYEEIEIRKVLNSFSLGPRNCLRKGCKKPTQILAEIA
jgi:hypothetical protein